MVTCFSFKTCNYLFMNLNPAQVAFIGVDIGGSHITASYVSADHNNIISDTKVRAKVDAHADAQSIIDCWSDVLTSLYRPHIYKDTKIGIAMPGPFDYQAGISLIKDMNKYESLYGLNVRNMLASRIGIQAENIMFRNDAEAFLHGEVAVAAFNDQVKTIGITLGTGLGSAVNYNGVTSDVFRAITPMHEGIAEDYISTRWFLKKYNQLTGLKVANVEELLGVEDLSVINLIFSEFAQNLGRFLNDFSQQENADVIVIGGNIARCLNVFKQEMTSYIEKPDILIRQTVLWEDAALVGAACSCGDNQFAS
jgi:glucokinase